MKMSNILPTEYQSYIHLSRYARWLPDKKRRETWDETVARYFDFFEVHLKENNNYILTKELRKELEEAVLNLEVLPSMRCLMTAGKALERDAVAGYNCSYLPIDHPRAFDEILYILMCGTGVGFSVERQYVSKLPDVPEEFHPTGSIIIVADSKLGWATAYKELVSFLYNGLIPKWDLTKIRPAGTPLKTFGGRASGPEPLERLFLFTINIFQNAKGRKLTSLECHDLVCKVAEVVVVGGTRRSALISLSNLSDDRMRDAKSGQWWTNNTQRALANNSAVYTEKPEIGIFMKEWLSLYDSKSGERGIVNRKALINQAKKTGRRETDKQFYGLNPCAEVILRPYQFCNLTEAVVRETDTYDSLRRKVRLASILGTFQSTLVNFRYLRKRWQDNTAEERLLGVSLTGIYSNPILNRKSTEFKKLGFGSFTNLPHILDSLKQEVIDENKRLAAELNIPQSVSATVIKPSGTVSQLVNAPSGIHASHSPYYIRTVRADKKDPLAKLMQDKGIPWEPDVMNPESVLVFSFPIQAAQNSIYRSDLSAIEHLETWLVYRTHWCEHNPSITVTVKENEWLEVAAWCYKHFDDLGGVSFLPHSDHIYQQAPYQECTKEQYEAHLAKMPKNIDWSELSKYEKTDQTEGAQELACVAGGCEI
jgi:ribonucleoside-diphosphate reductase alpha chain